ncbi:PEP-CTERM sorting domain-containing protein [Phragmitibacter flavus]|uniref:PEP-CTERM sorting domain-containing protein n=1 Tax=Phragmitibacter flavus TaxID=2576071 RepID=A0A5R8KIR3_9BACT|nr:PEP-CTERM sorting domain-containing protein [Phragmitibacter flavus]TLD72147.1 PEP-CTERM sorting domain-containing protein [Phragmitibacter flavus]
MTASFRPQHRPFLVIAIVAVAALSAMLPSQAATLLTEHFWRSTGNGGVTGLGWNAYRGSTAVNLSAAAPSGATYEGAGWINNNTVASAPDSNVAGSTAGYIYAQNRATAVTEGTPVTSGSTPPNYFIHTTTGISQEVSNFSSLSASWSQSTSANLNANTRLALRVDNVWYVALTPDNNTLSSTWQTLGTNILAESWYRLDFTASSNMSVDTGTTYTSATFGNTISGIGFYVDALQTASTSVVANADFRTIRFDLLTLTGEAVPEPSRALLMFSALGLILLRRQRSFSL